MSILALGVSRSLGVYFPWEPLLPPTDPSHAPPPSCRLGLAGLWPFVASLPSQVGLLVIGWFGSKVIGNLLADPCQWFVPHMSAVTPP